MRRSYHVASSLLYAFDEIRYAAQRRTGSDGYFGYAGSIVEYSQR